MRISKEPEVRKQEILDAAMRVFAEKGYEASTMKDIAREANVVAGLCYHYFQNKQELYQTALARYARECSQAFIAVFVQTEMPLKECLDALENVSVSQEADYKYKDFFDKAGNELFHKQLELSMSKEIFPYVEQYLESRIRYKEINTDADPYLLACFLWNGQMAVMNEEAVPLKERIAFLRDIFAKIIQ